MRGRPWVRDLWGRGEGEDKRGEGGREQIEGNPEKREERTCDALEILLDSEGLGGVGVVDLTVSGRLVDSGLGVV